MQHDLANKPSGQETFSSYNYHYPLFNKEDMYSRVEVILYHRVTCLVQLEGNSVAWSTMYHEIILKSRFFCQHWTSSCCQLLIHIHRMADWLKLHSNFLRPCQKQFNRLFFVPFQGTPWIQCRRGNRVLGDTNTSPNMQPSKPFYPLKVEDVFLESLAGLCVCRLIGNVRILFVSAAFVILTSMRLPV